MIILLACARVSGQGSGCGPRRRRTRRQLRARHRAGPPTVLHIADHANLPHAVLDLGRPVGNEAVLAVERVRARVGIGDPERRRLRGVDDCLQQRSPSTCAVVGCIHVEHIQLPRPRRRSVQGRARHGDPDQFAIPLGDSRPVLAISLVGQRGSPEPLPSSQEARIIEHRIRHEPPIRLLPAPHIYTRHLRNVLDPGRANSQRGTHRRIVGRDQMSPHRTRDGFDHVRQPPRPQISLSTRGSASAAPWKLKAPRARDS